MSPGSSTRTGRKAVVCATLLAESSPQAIPLGAACVCSAVKADRELAEAFDCVLADFSAEDAQIASAQGEKGRAQVIARGILEAAGGAELFAACLSVYVWNRRVLEEAALLLKEIAPSVLCIAGGPEVTANPFGFAQGSFDLAVVGAGETAVPAILKNPDSKIPGVYRLDGSRRGGAREQGAGLPREIERAPSCPLEELPSPYLDGTIDPAKYGGALWELARGCPFSCAYCYESKGAKKVSRFPDRRLQEEIELFAKKKVPQVFVLDPTYNADKARAARMIAHIRKFAPDTFFYFEARAEFIDRPLAKAFASITCALQIGLQSADEAVLRNVNRSFDKRQFERNIRILNEEGVVFGLDLIYGLPGDTLEGFKKSVDFALSLAPNNLELFRLSVLPGTDLFEKKDEFSLCAQTSAPYHIISSPTFGEEDLSRAESLARATSAFYTQGRAVPWFLAVLRPLKTRPSEFLQEFARLMESKGIRTEGVCGAREARTLQKDFVRERYKAKGLFKLLDAAQDLIEFFGALSDADGEGLSSQIRLRYHPDDLAFAGGLKAFCAAARKGSFRTEVFPSPDGAAWRVL